MIKNIVFDLGGVIMHLDHERAVRRFEELGVKDVRQLLDPYEQKGFFLEVEDGRLDAEGFRLKLSEHAGRCLSFEEIAWGWMGFVVEVPQYKLDYMLASREHYNIYILSNTNPYILDAWARTSAFSEAGRPLTDYCEKIYASYEMGVTKPDERIFTRMMADASLILEETLFVDDGRRNIETAAALGMHTCQPANMEDWRETVTQILQRH